MGQCLSQGLLTEALKLLRLCNTQSLSQSSARLESFFMAASYYLTRVIVQRRIYAGGDILYIYVPRRARGKSLPGNVLARAATTVKKTYIFFHVMLRHLFIH